MEAVMFVNYVFLHADDCQDAVHVLSWVTRSVWCGSCRCFLAVDAEGRLIQSWLSRLSCRQQNLIPPCKQQQNLIPTCKQQNLIPCLTNQKHVPCHLATASPNRAIHHVILSLVISSLVTLHTAKASLVISSLVTLHTAKAGCPWKTMIGMSILVSELATCSWQRKSDRYEYFGKWACNLQLTTKIIFWHFLACSFFSIQRSQQCQDFRTQAQRCQDFRTQAWVPGKIFPEARPERKILPVCWPPRTWHLVTFSEARAKNTAGIGIKQVHSDFRYRAKPASTGTLASSVKCRVSSVKWQSPVSVTLIKSCPNVLIQMQTSKPVQQVCRPVNQYNEYKANNRIL